jgi:hypothetical protein
VPEINQLIFDLTDVARIQDEQKKGHEMVLHLRIHKIFHRLTLKAFEPTHPCIIGQHKCSSRYKTVTQERKHAKTLLNNKVRLQELWENERVYLLNDHHIY